MKTLLPVVAATLLLTSVANAQPLDITIPYSGDPADSAPRPYYNDDYVYGDPWNRDFDPAAAAINALNISHFNVPRGRSSFNVDRAITLNATGDSIATHQMKCQAAYASYDLASDTYLTDNGIPRPCRL
jgi:hypothetical protein